MRKFLTATLLCMALTVTMVPAAFAADTADSNYTTCMAAIQEQKVIQDQAHQTAESLRQKGYDDSSAYIQAAQSTWWAAQDEIVAYQKLSQYTDEDIRILTTAVFYEAGHTTEQLREYVAQVVLNRVADSRFPDTVKGVIPARPVCHQVRHPGGHRFHQVCRQPERHLLLRHVRNGGEEGHDGPGGYAQQRALPGQLRPGQGRVAVRVL